MVGEQVISLPLFDEPVKKDRPVITEEQVVTPLVEILDHTIPTTKITSPLGEIPKSVDEALDVLFPEQQYEEKTIQTAKEMLGVVAKELSPEELKCAIVKMQYLVETWMDDFERGIFNGLTLNELLHEKGRRL